jgi:hypothetical protein
LVLDCGGVEWWADASSGRLAAGFMADGMGGDGAGRVGERDRHRNAGRVGWSPRVGSDGRDRAGSRWGGGIGYAAPVSCHEWGLPRSCPGGVRRAAVLKCNCYVHTETRHPWFLHGFAGQTGEQFRQKRNLNLGEGFHFGEKFGMFFVDDSIWSIFLT